MEMALNRTSPFSVLIIYADKQRIKALELNQKSQLNIYKWDKMVFMFSSVSFRLLARKCAAANVNVNLHEMIMCFTYHALYIYHHIIIIVFDINGF